MPQQHWGDLMGASSFEKLSLDSPLERILTTANGNLQRIVSSWCNAPVTVEIVKNDFNDTTKVFEREVNLLCNGIHFANATSSVKIESEEILNEVASGRIGIGQVFREYNILPEFVLKRADSGKMLQRNYLLQGSGVICDIFESIDVNEIERQVNVSRSGEITTGANHFGDVMSGKIVSISLSNEFTPFERVLITSNGNVLRLLSSYFNRPVVLEVLENRKDRRVVEMKMDKHLVCKANSIIETDLDIENVGGIFGVAGQPGAILPGFQLVDARYTADSEQPKHLKRVYLLTAPRVRITVEEIFYLLPQPESSRD